MTVASCPSCHEDVTIPADALPDSTVQCPLCREEFTLSAFLAQLPPSLIIKQQGGSHLGSAAAEFGSPSQDVNGPHVDVAIERDSAGPAGTTVGFPDEAAASTPSQFDVVDRASDSGASIPRTSHRKDKVRAAEKNHLLEFAKIAAGGLLALPLAQLILWWLPGQWQRDPFQIGPEVGRLIPWVVPSNYRPVSQPAAARSQAETWPDTEPFARRPGTSGQAISSDSSRVDPGQDSVTTSPAIDFASDSAPTARDRDQLPAGDGTLLGVKDAPTYSADQLRDALENAMQASAAWDASADQAQQTLEQRGDDFYAAFAQLGLTITFVRPGQAAMREPVESLYALMQSFVRQPNKLAMIGNHAADWLVRPDRISDGVLLFGTVKQIELQGPLFETQLELASRQRRTVTVISKVDPKPVYSVRSRILMLGAIIDDPQANLIGYQGDLPSVIMGALPVPVLP